MSLLLSDLKILTHISRNSDAALIILNWLINFKRRLLKALYKLFMGNYVEERKLLIIAVSLGN